MIPSPPEPKYVRVTPLIACSQPVGRNLARFYHPSGPLVKYYDGVKRGGEAIFLTQAAPAAEIRDHHRAVDPVSVLFRADRLVSTVFLADQAVLIQAPGNAPIPVDPGGSHLEVPFNCQVQMPDGLGGTGLPALIAELVTLPGRGNQTGGEKSLKAPFQK